MSKKKKSENMWEFFSNEFEYNGVDYSYDRYICLASHCGCRTGNDYCRHSEYQGLRVDKIDLTKIRQKFTEHNTDYDDTFMDYCVDRLLRVHQVFNPDNWEVVVTGGYYGDEISGIQMDNHVFESLCKDIESLYKMEIQERIPFILTQEYQKVLPILDNCTYEELTVPVESLIVGNEIYHKKIKDNPYTKENYDLPIGIYVKQGDEYRLIDGYHRFSLTNNAKDVRIIAAL